MNVRDVMTRDVRVVSADASIREAAEAMGATNIGVLPVTRGQSLVGMLTDRDIAIRVVARGMDAEMTPVGDVMTPTVMTVTADQEISEAARAMQAERVRRAPVLDSSHGVVGILSLGDLAVRSGDAHLCGEVLRSVSHAAAANGPTPTA